jgi:hypothetical protein
MLIIFPNPILELQHALLPQSVANHGTCPQLLVLLMFSLQTPIAVHQGAWEHITL